MGQGRPSPSSQTPLGPLQPLHPPVLAQPRAPFPAPSHSISQPCTALPMLWLPGCGHPGDLEGHPHYPASLGDTGSMGGSIL